MNTKRRICMKKKIQTAVALLLSLTLVAVSLVSCGEKKKQIVIYSSAEDYRIEYMQEMLDKKFPEYDIVIDYRSSGDHAAVLKASGAEVSCDITHDLEYGYAMEMASLGILADLKDIADFSVYADDAIIDTHFLPEIRNGGAIIVNMDVIAREGLTVPASYNDLLDPQYKDMISMPNPASSGTGYMFLLSLVNAWGEQEAFDYFDKLANNVLSFTSSGSGPVNALLSGEAAIALGMTANAVTKINEDGANFKILFFEEGSPYSMYAQGVIAGRETDEDVMRVFEYLSTTVNEGMLKNYYPEKIYKELDVELLNYPTDIEYADMSGNTPERKDELLAKWKH